MSRFNLFLHRTGERLMLPKATRSLIILEIASDLEDLFQHYVQQGLSEEEATARAEERVDMSDEALAELVRIHADTGGWADRIVRRAQSFWERLVMAAIALFFIAGATFDGSIRPFAHVTGLAWAIAVILLALIVSFVVQLTRLTDRANPRRLRDGLATPLFLGAASVVVGFAGSGIEIYRTLMQMAADPERAAPLFGQTILGVTGNLTVSLLVALCAGVAWFVLAGRVTRIEDNAARAYTGVNS